MTVDQEIPSANAHKT